MSGFNKKSLMIVVTTALVLALVAPPALAAERKPFDEASAEAIVFDLIFLRPLGIVATVAGSAIFVVALPFSAAGGNTGETAQKLVVAPAKFTFARPLGRFEN